MYARGRFIAKDSFLIKFGQQKSRSGNILPAVLLWLVWNCHRSWLRWRLRCHASSSLKMVSSIRAGVYDFGKYFWSLS